MGENSAIEWTDHTFNPWQGCMKVSPACDHCYAEVRDLRFHRGVHWGPTAPRQRTKNWSAPRKWNRDARTSGTRARVFCASLADVFDNQAPPEWRTDLWALIADTQRLDWMLLTKRPQNIRKMLPATWGNGWPNVWLGCTTENQEEANRRIPLLRSIPARVRFLSCEPLLEPTAPDLDGIDWVICGGESGRGARYMEPDWARALRDQCAEAGVAFFMKQMTGKQPIPDDLLVRQWPVPGVALAA